MSKKNIESSNYNSLFKAFSLLGGSQIINILLSIIRTKVVAVFLGTYGMGVLGLFTSSISLVRNLTDFGINISAIKDIAKANELNDNYQLSFIVRLVRKLVWWTGILGVIVMVFFSKQLSYYSFGNAEYTYHFITISISLLFYQLAVGELVVLQGLSRLREIAKIQILGSFITLILACIIYPYLEVKGIIFVIVLSSIASYLIALFYSRKIKLEKIELGLRTIFSKGQVILKLGFLLSLSILLSKFVEYIIRIYIIQNGSIDDIGLYNAGFSIINTYVVIFFASISSDFYPRLSKVANNIPQFTNVVNQQTEILLLLLSPLLILCLVIANWLVIILYSVDFVSITPMMQWIIIGMYLKLTSWLLGYLVLAKNDTKVFLYTQLFKNSIELVLSIYLYKCIGLLGLGISFFVTLLLSYILSIFIAYFRYKFRYNKEVVKIFMIQFFLGLFSFVCINYIHIPCKTLLVIGMFIVSTYYSYTELIKRINIRLFVEKILNKGIGNK